MQILLADDHALFRDGLRQLLRRLDEAVEVVAVADVEAALAHLDAAGEPDLLLLDLGLPGRDGVELLQALARRGACIPSLVVSASEDPRAVRRALDAGALGFVPKSHDAGAMLEAIRHVLAGETYLPAPMAAAVAALETAPVADLTPRQREVLRLLAEGCANKEIARRLDLTEHTVKAHLGAIFRAFGVRNRTQCVETARRLGLLDPS